MNRSLSIIGLFLALVLVILVSSFVVLDVQSNSEPLTIRGLSWIDDHKVVSALAVSEAAGLMSKKVRGILHGVLVGIRSIIDLVSLTRAKAPKK